MVGEAIYHLKNSNLILLHCFLANLVETFISGPTIVTAINGKTLPSANDTTYRKWLKENGKEKNVPNYDLDVYMLIISENILSKATEFKANLITLLM